MIVLKVFYCDVNFSSTWTAAIFTDQEISECFIRSIFSSSSIIFSKLQWCECDPNRVGWEWTSNTVELLIFEDNHPILALKKFVENISKVQRFASVGMATPQFLRLMYLL